MMARSLVAALSAAAISVAGATGALADIAGAARPFPGPADRPADAATLAQKSDAPETAVPAGESAWSVQCPGSGATACRVFQNMVVPGTGERLLTVLIEPQPSDHGFRLALALPHGLYFPAGVEIAIDGGDPISLEIMTSDADGAYAAIPADPNLIAAMKAGTSMTVSFRASTQQGFTVPVTLAGFAQAMGVFE